VAKGDLDQELALLSSLWVWEFTQYDAERGSRPDGEEEYLVDFDDKGKIRVTAECGTKKGDYTIRGKSITIEMKRLNWFGCRKDDHLQVFFGDLQRGAEFFIEEDQLHRSR
jgi:hypothetical protein